jgi:hypothetical protein
MKPAHGARKQGSLLLCLALLGGCATLDSRHRVGTAPSPYILVFAADQDEKQDDFLAVIDVRAGSPTVGRVIATTPVGMTASMPHHFEYEMPPAGELLFGNAHHHEHTLLIDTADPLKPVVKRVINPPAPYRFTHDYKRLPTGNRLVGFLRSDGPSPREGELSPGGHGGIAEYTASGDLLRTASAAVAGAKDPIRPYAFVPMLDQDRVVTTSAPMMENFSADVIQIWRYSDLKLLHTIAVPPGQRADGSPLPGAGRYPFGPRLMRDGSVLMNAYGCGFFRLTGIATDVPKLEHVYTIQVPDPEKATDTRGACGIPVVIGRHWVMPVGRAHTVVVLDVSDPAAPREVSRLDTPADFNPHWLARDLASNRLVLGAELGGEKGMYLLDLDPATGQLRPDASIVAPDGTRGYISLDRPDWPHGASGAAWAHAGLFLPEKRRAP